MPFQLQRFTGNRVLLTGKPAAVPINPMRAGMPSLDTIHASVAITSKPTGQAFHILRTTEVDSYESSPPVANLAKALRTKGAISAATLNALLLKAKAPTGDSFAGTARKAAKLSVAGADVEDFADLGDLVNSFTADDDMIHRNPKISTAATSNRVKDEKRNVRVSAFLYAASREADNDFHLIIGRDPADEELYMTMEISGLPPHTNKFPAFDKIKEARDAFKDFFGGNLPGTSYDFYDPPRPVTIEGSLYFDMSHATGPHPGPQSLKSRMPTVWEVHPITSITIS